MEEGECRTARAVPSGSPAPSWLRHLQADRGPFRRCSEFSRDLFVSAAPPAGEPGLDRGEMGGEVRAAPPPVLPADLRGPPGAPYQAAELEGLYRRNQPCYGDRTCLIGTILSAAGWLV